MKINKTISDSNSNMIASKRITTRNTIKKKFEKARMNRVEEENDMNHAMKPLTTLSYAITSAKSSDLKTRENNFSSRNRSSKKFLSNQCIAPKASLMQTDPKRQYNINVFCKRLRLLLSPQFVNSAICIQEISKILKQLHDLEIVV